MRRNKHLYEVRLCMESRDDVRHDWNKTYELKFTTNTLDKVMDYIYTHRYLETELDSNDDGSGWLHIQTLFYKRIR